MPEMQPIIFRALTEQEDQEYMASIAEALRRSLIVEVRQQRNNLLAASDWTQLLDIPLSPEMRAQWAAYRQALRDVPMQQNYPHDVTWPILPGSPDPGNESVPL